MAAEAPRGPSWAANGEFLIDGLGVDGRDCTRDEPGWAEPGTMSVLWGYQAGSSAAARRFSQINSSTLPSAPLPPTVPVSKPDSQQTIVKSEAEASPTAIDDGSTSVARRMSTRRPTQLCCGKSDGGDSHSRSHVLSGTDTRRSSKCPACRHASDAGCAHCLNGPAQGRSAMMRDIQKLWTRETKKQPSLEAIEEAEEGQMIGGSSITIIDIIQGRTCRPISLMDLRAFLAQQRSEQGRSGLFQPASAMLPDLSMLGGALVGSDEKEPADLDQTLVALPTDHTVKRSVSADRAGSQRSRAGTNGDELDALDFLIAFHRWEARFYLSARVSSPTGATADEKSPFSMDRADLRLRKEMVRLLQVYFGDVPIDPKDSTVPDKRAGSRRLVWMSDLGLLDEHTLQRALHEASSQTSPSVLSPLADAVARYINTHCLPAFFLSKSKNLNRHTERGRLAIGMACLTVATVLTVLLALRPSPLLAGSSNPDRVIDRWYRLALAPLWIAGTGYVLAAWTGVCVWLSLRGNRELREGEELHRTNTFASSHDGLDTAPLPEEELRQDRMGAEARQRWVAPEIKQLLLRMVGKPGGVGPEPKPSHLTVERPHPEAAKDHPPSSPTVPMALALASPSVTSKRVPILPVHVAILKPAAFAAPEQTFAARPGHADGAGVRGGDARRGKARFSRHWAAIKHATGFAVDTEPVLDERVRREQQKQAFKALAVCTAASLVLLIVCVAVP